MMAFPAMWRMEAKLQVIPKPPLKQNWKIEILLSSAVESPLRRPFLSTRDKTKIKEAPAPSTSHKEEDGQEGWKVA